MKKIKLFIVALLAVFVVVGVAPAFAADQPSKFGVVQIDKSKKVKPVVEIPEDDIWAIILGGGGPN